MRASLFCGVVLSALLSAGCDGAGSATIDLCEPEGSCFCAEGTELETRCTCVGGSTCSVSGGGVELDCQGNAVCNLDCGEDCIIVCPGTTTCTVTTGEGSAIRCPGTASCDITCDGSCAVEVAGAADVVVRCDAEATGGACEISGCSPEDCGQSVYACGTSCPMR